MAFSEGELALSAGGDDAAQANESLPVDFVGEPLTIAFNPGYLLDGLGALGTTFTRLGFTAPLKPAMITGQDTIEAEADTSYRYVLQPVRLAG